MIGRKRLAVMARGKQDIVAVEVWERDVGSESLLGVNEDESSAKLQLHATENLAKSHALPSIVEATPAGDAMKIARDPHPWQRLKLAPGEAQLRFDGTVDPEVPSFGIEARNGTVVQDWPLQGERLTWRKAAFRFHKGFAFFALLAFE